MPCLILDSAPRNRVHVIHGTDKQLGYRLTTVDFGNVSYSDDPSHPKYVFDKSVDNLLVQRYMQAPMEQRLIAKSKKELPTNVSCKRCLRLKNRGDAKSSEDDLKVKGHSCGTGCNYFSYHCFDEGQLEFSTESASCFHQECPLAHCFHRLSQEFSEKSIGVNTFSELPREDFRYLNRKVDEPRIDRTQYNHLEHVFESASLRTMFFGTTEVNPEESATITYLAKTQFLPAFFSYCEAASKRTRGDQQEHQERFAAIVVPHKDVLLQSKRCPAQLEQYLAGANKELSNLFERKVIQLVEWKDLKDIPSDQYEIIPSICIWSDKGNDVKKARLVACGNFQRDLKENPENVYAGTTTNVIWRALLTLFTQSKGSIGCLDISEAV